jgi:hypothetical protein
MSFTRRTWMGTTLATVLATLAGLFGAPARAQAAPPPPKRKRWIGHY